MKETWNLRSYLVHGAHTVVHFPDYYGDLERDAQICGTSRHSLVIYQFCQTFSLKWLWILCGKCPSANFGFNYRLSGVNFLNPHSLTLSPLLLRSCPTPPPINESLIKFLKMLSSANRRCKSAITYLVCGVWKSPALWNFLKGEQMDIIPWSLCWIFFPLRRKVSAVLKNCLRLVFFLKNKVWQEVCDVANRVMWLPTHTVEILRVWSSKCRFTWIQL